MFRILFFPFKLLFIFAASLIAGSLITIEGKTLSNHVDYYVQKLRGKRQMDEIKVYWSAPKRVNPRLRTHGKPQENEGLDRMTPEDQKAMKDLLEDAGKQ